jgi:hypothetical protein
LTLGEGRRGNAVYNPFDILQLFDKQEFQPYWFESATPSFLVKLLAALQANDIKALEAHLKALFAGLPHDWYRSDFNPKDNPIARYEGHTFSKVYASVFYSHLAALGLDIVVEDAGNTGKVDMSVDFNGHLYLFEFKVVEQVPEGRALAQLKARGYADKYRGAGKPIHLIGVEFSRERRQIVAFEVEEG